MAESLRQRSLAGLGWAFGQQAGSQLSRVLFSILLARVLAPDDYGLLGLGLLCVNFLQILATFGLGDGLIQAGRRASPGELSTLFRLHALLASSAALTLLLAAPAIAAWYRLDGLSDILRLLALTFLFSIGIVVPRAALEKDLHFEIVARRAVPATVVSGLLALAAAHAGWGVYSLVVLSLAEPAILALSLLPWIPRHRPAPLRQVLPVMRYSWKLALAGVVGFAGKNIDAVVIGRWIGARDLGLYQLGFRLTRLPSQNLAAVLDRVLFPAYASIQDDPARVARAYARVLRGMSWLMFPVMTLVAASLEWVAPLLLTHRWDGVVPVMQVFCALAVVQTMGRSMNAVIQALGRSDVVLAWVFLAAPLNVAAVAISARWGILAVAGALVATRLVIQLGQQHVLARLLGVPHGRLLKAEFAGLPLALLQGSFFAMGAWAGWHPLTLSALAAAVVLMPAGRLVARRGVRGALAWLTGDFSS
ncbi:MAG: lipopolysaccharide biosynthesis protein [bacterium]|jgi:O-antigen/teichoic acid export membrane protein|nr:lipopolysaccharide biosynthesis protein [bacterium]